MEGVKLAKDLLDGDGGRSGARSGLCSAGLLLLAVTLLSFVFGTASASAKVPADSENAKSTHAYLIATNAFDETELRNLPQSEAAVEALATRISGECPGVLAGAPGEQELVVTSLQAVSPVSPRAEGERHRQAIQQEDLKLEMGIALEAASAQPNHEATEALVGALTPLRWHNATALALLVHVIVASAKEQLESPVPDVCADMRQWVASGFKTLSPASKEIASRGDALLEYALELFAISEQDHLKSLAGVLGRYENASDRSIARRNETLQAELHSSSVIKNNTLKDLEAKVGLPAPKTYKKLLPSPKKPPVIARGRTAVGGGFVVRAERRARRPDPVGCSAYITIEEPSRSGEGLLELLESGGGTSRCVSRAHVNAEPTVRCNSGLLTVEANLLPATRSVRLLLSNGKTITSPAIRVPAREGGPAGVYYQVVRGPSPIPASLTELDASGDTLAVLKLPAVVECAKHLIKYLPDGIVTLAHGSLPQGPGFTIRGEGYRKLGTLHFELKLAVSTEGKEGFFEASGGISFETSVEEPEVSNGEFHLRAQLLGTVGLTFASHASSGCEPQPYVIVYGLLKAPGDTALARVAGTLVPLQKVAIPARLHAYGALAYGSFSPLPTELLVRDASGKTVASRNLSAAAQSSTERCEGEAE